MQKQKIIVICGPTSSGKTAISIEIAKSLKKDGIIAEIISADSRQVYVGLNLGTGKVTKKEMTGVQHHMLDVCNPKKQFSVAIYKKLADKKIIEIFKRGNIPIICGGTGFYIDSLVSGKILPEVPVNKELRKKLFGKSAEELLKQLKKLDPIRAGSIEQKNPVRLIRAIEIAKSLGHVPPIQKIEIPYKVLKIGLDMENEILKERINIRLKERIKKGMLKEAKKLHEKGLSWKRMQEIGLEYRAMATFLTGKIKKEDFEKDLAFNIWHYAKRQRVWFKKDKEILWFNPLQKDTYTKIEKIVKSFLTN